MQNFVLHPSQQTGVNACVFDTPHSGIILPDHFHYACTIRDLMFMHDPHIEKLLAHVPLAGVPVLEALIHKSCINLNRDPGDIDPAMIDGEWKHQVNISPYVARKDGLFPSLSGPRTNRITPVYNAHARLPVAEAERRIECYYTPYYAALAHLIEQARKHNGMALYIDVHSSHRERNQPQADIVLGDLNGQSCAPDLTKKVKIFFEDSGFTVDFNGSYFSGGALIQKNHNLPNNIHSLQIEIARDLYMDQNTLEYDVEKGMEMRQSLQRLAYNLSHAFTK